MSSNIEIKTIPEIHLAAFLSNGVQNVQSAYEKLISWAGAKNLFPNETTKLVTVYLDSFRNAPPDKVRMLASMQLDGPIENDDLVISETLSAGKYIVGSYTISHDEYGKEWANLFQWMNENGYQYKNTPPFEIYHNNYMEHPEKKSMVDFYIPVL